MPSNLFDFSEYFIALSLFRAFINSLEKFLWAFIPVPTAVPPIGNLLSLIQQLFRLNKLLSICDFHA